ncbi:hypothetical protein GCM10010387_16180 [Streptomyces inusitatus]|uniref:Uncharacterized protein n=1 Tax=Streptomyces inusitatus TaxID=68221 RepID=A0A918PUT9_9ACTN|nr:hypothetical protein [Streptomyces inusitatus]GGZ23727.1 hypothetical protein GCM10010387_16180 [Streptomyces inusitatus]
MNTTPVPATGPEAAARLHHTDPRIRALAIAAHKASPDARRPWAELSEDERHTWRTSARNWLRAAVTVGLLPLVIPSTGQALAAVPLDVVPGDGRPRAGSRGRAQTFRDAAHAIRPEAFGWGGPDHHDAWTEARKRLDEIAEDEEGSVGDYRSADQAHAALVRVEVWADDLDEEVRRTAERIDVSDPVADRIRALLDGARHGEDPL